MENKTQKEQYFKQEAISILRKFESRTYKELEEFCEYLKESGKSATLQLRGAESSVSEDSFYKNLIDGYKQY